MARISATPMMGIDMFAPLLAKVVIATVLGFSAGFLGEATANVNQAPPAPRNVGTFGGPVTHVGAIEWDLSTSAGVMTRVRCAGKAAGGTTCYVAG